MRKDSIPLEETRLAGVKELDDFVYVHERHRIFPSLFEDRHHKKIIDLSAGVGCAAQRIQDDYPANIICNDISPTSLKVLKDLGLDTLSFDLDNDDENGFPFPGECFDAVISLATIEHLIYTDNFMKESSRILKDGGYLYLSTPNYASAIYLPEFLLSGRTFHNPLSTSVRTRYEFYAHVRYFTYRTLLEYVSSFGFTPEAVYLALPKGSTRYKSLYQRSKMKALAYRYVMWVAFLFFSPRWAPEPVLCFKKHANNQKQKPKKVIL